MNERFDNQATLLGVFLLAKHVFAGENEILSPRSFWRQGLAMTSGQNPSGGQKGATTHMARFDSALFVEPIEGHLPGVVALLRIVATHDARRTFC